MATFTALGVDGRPYRIRAPEGYTQEQAYAAARANNPGVFPDSQGRRPDPRTLLGPDLPDMAPLGQGSLVAYGPNAQGAPTLPTPDEASRTEGTAPWRQVADVPLNVAQGAVAGVRMVADAFGASNPVSQALRTSEGYIGDLLSAQAKEDQQEIARIMAEAEGKGVGTEVRAALKALTVAPIDLVSNALGTMAPMVLAALGGKVLGAGAVGMRVLSAGTAAVQGAGIGKDALYQTTYDVLTENGVSEDEARRRAEQAQSYTGGNLDLIATNTAAGALAGAVGAERSLANVLSRRFAQEAARDTLTDAIEGATREASRSGAAAVARGAATEALPEGVQGALEQITGNVGATREGYARPTFAGAAGAGTLEAAVAAPIGGFAGVRDRIDARRRASELEALRTARDSMTRVDDDVAHMGDVLPTGTVPGEGRVRGREYDLFGEVPSQEVVGPPTPPPVPGTEERIAELTRRIEAADPTKPAGVRRIAQARAELTTLNRQAADAAGQLDLFESSAAFQVTPQGLRDRFQAVADSYQGGARRQLLARADRMAQELAPILETGDAEAITTALEAQLDSLSEQSMPFIEAVEQMVETALDAAAIYEPVAAQRRQAEINAMAQAGIERASPGVQVGRAEPTETSAQLMRDAEARRQSAERFELELADTDTRVAARREQQLLERRESILRDVINDPDVRNPRARFRRELERAGYADANLTTDELFRIEQARVAREGFAQTDTLPSLPDEQDPAAMGIRERREPPVIPEGPQPRRNENRSFYLRPPPSTQSDLNALQRAEERRARRAGEEEGTAVPEPYAGPAPVQGELELDNTRALTMDHLRGMGIGPTNKSLRPLLGRDLNNPQEAAEVAQALRDYANERGRSPALRERILNAIQTGDFRGPSSDGGAGGGASVPVSGGERGGPSRTADQSGPAAASPGVPAPQEGAGPGDGPLAETAQEDARAMQDAVGSAVARTAEEIGAPEPTTESVVQTARRKRRKPKTFQPSTTEEAIVDAASIEEDVQAVIEEELTPEEWARTVVGMVQGVRAAQNVGQLLDIALQASSARLAPVISRLKAIAGVSDVRTVVQDTSPQGEAYLASFRGQYGADPARNDEVVVFNGPVLEGMLRTDADPRAQAENLAALITHEVVHAATAKAMDPALSDAMGLPLERIEAFQQDIAGIQAALANALSQGTFSNASPDVRQLLQTMVDIPSEIPAYALTVPEVQEALRSIGTDRRRTLWSRFVSAVRDMLGMDDGRQTLLDDVLVLSDKLMAAQNSWAAAGGDLAPVYRTVSLNADPAVASVEEARRLNANAGNIRGLRPEPDTTFLQRLREKVSQWNFRANAIDSMSPLAAVFEQYMQGQSGQTDVWNLETGQVRPDALARQADQSDSVAMAILQEGGVMYNSEYQAFTAYRPQMRLEQRKDGKYRVYDTVPDWKDNSIKHEVLVFDGLSENNAKFLADHPASLTNVMSVLHQLGDRLGDQQLAREMANKALYAARYAELKAEFDRQRQAADNLEAKGKVKEAEVARAAIRPLPQSIFMEDGSTIPLEQAITAGMEILAKTPELRIIQQMNRLLNLRMVDALQRSGRIDAITADTWRQHPSYVPFMRDRDYFNTEGKSLGDLTQAAIDMRKLPELQGGDAPLRDVFQNIMEEVFWMTSASMRTQANRGMMDALKEVYGSKLTQVTSDTPRRSYSPEQVVTIFREGKPEQYEVPALDMVWGFEGTPLMMAEAPVRWMAAWSNILRKLVTANPEFAISQNFQDAWRAMVASQTKSPFVLAGRVFSRFATELAGGDESTDVLSRLGIGGKIDSIPGHARDQVMQQMNLKAQRNVVDVANAVQNFMGYPAIAQDMSLRTATYLQSMSEGHSPAVAAMKAREIINFNRIGRSQFIRTMRMYVPFFNAWIQGMDVMYRAATVPGLNARQRSMMLGPFVATAAKIATLSTFYSMLLGGNDEWESMSDQERDRMLFIPSEWAGTEHPLKIPVAPEVGFMLKGITDRAYRQIISQNTDNPRDAKKLMQSIAAGAADALMGPNLTPQVFKPALEVATNYDFRTGGPVVGRVFEGLSPEDQYDAYTSQISMAIARGAAKAGLPLSPMKVDHLLRGHFGITGGMVLDASTALFGTGADLPTNRKPILKLFTTAPQGREVSQNFYEYSENVMQTVNSLQHMIRNGMLAEWAERIEDPKVLERWARQADVKYGQEITAYFREQRNRVQNMPVNLLSRSDKEKELRRIDKEEHEARQAYMQGKVPIR